MMFQDRLRLATPDLPLIMYIDALDQLNPQDPAVDMNWLPRELPPHCRVVLSTIDIPPALSGAKSVEVQPFSTKEAETALDLWFTETRRRLQPEQRAKLLASFHRTGLPLYLKLGFEEARLWKSFDTLEECVLGEGLAGIIDRLFDRLKAKEYHGRIFTEHALGYLAAARYGLTEDEMLAVLAANDGVWNDFESTKKHDLPEEMLAEGGKDKRRLPVVLWSRLFLDLEPYLTERAVPGGVTVGFYHRQLAERAPRGAAYHADLAAYFVRRPNWLGPQLADQRKITELVRQQVRVEALLDDAVAVLTNIDFISAKCAAELVFDLQEDYREAIAAMPGAQAELREEKRLRAQEAGWAQTLIECAKEKRLPRPQEIPPSARIWTNAEIEAEGSRIAENSSQLDLLKVFGRFVERGAHLLLEFGTVPGFLSQYAYHDAPSGPVRAAAAPPVIARRWPVHAQFVPRLAELRTLQGGTSSLAGVALSADGRVAVSASRDKTLKVWDAVSGAELHTLNGHTDWVNDVALSADGRVAVSASSDGTVKVWDLASGVLLRTLKGHTSGVTAVAVDSDGCLAVSGSWDQTLKVWDVVGNTLLHTLQGHTEVVEAVALSTDGRVSLSASSDKTLKVWDLAGGRELDTLQGHIYAVNGVALSADGRIAVSAAGDKQLKVWDLTTSAELRALTGHTESVNAVAMSADGRVAVSASHDKTLKVWDVATGSELRTLTGHTEAVDAVTLSADGRVAFSASYDHTLKVWDVATGSESPRLTRHENNVFAVALSWDGRVAVSASWDKTLKVWDVATGAELRRLTGHTLSVDGVALSADGRVAVSASWDKTLRVWDVPTGVELRALHGHARDVRGVAVSANGLMAVSASEDNTLKVWDVATGAELETLAGHQGSVDGVALSADGRVAISASWDKTLKIWDLAAGSELVTLHGHTDIVSGVALSPDARVAVSASWDKTLKVWDVATGAELRTLHGHTGSVHGVALSKDGRIAVSASSDGTVRVWTVDNGQCILIPALGFLVHCVALANGRIAAGTRHGEVFFFDLDLSRLGSNVHHPGDPRRRARS